MIFAIILFILCCTSAFYTYAIYPLVLCIAKKTIYKECALTTPALLIVVVSKSEKPVPERMDNISQCDYPKEMIRITWVSGIEELNRIIKQSREKIFVFTDDTAIFEKTALREIVKYFSDSRVGMVCGQPRNYELSKTGGKEGIIWGYERMVKQLESRIGCLSGANNALYAVRKAMLKDIPLNIINLGFYISTSVEKQGYAVVLSENATVYGIGNDDFDSLISHRIREGMGYWQALSLFKDIFFRAKEGFVFFSHRVLKWIFPFEMIIVATTNLILCFYSIIWTIPLLMQLIFYISAYTYYSVAIRRKKSIKGKFAKVGSIAFYLVILNYTMLIGLREFCFEKH